MKIPYLGLLSRGSLDLNKDMVNSLKPKCFFFTKSIIYLHIKRNKNINLFYRNKQIFGAIIRNKPISLFLIYNSAVGRLNYTVYTWFLCKVFVHNL